MLEDKKSEVIKKHPTKKQKSKEELDYDPAAKWSGGPAKGQSEAIKKLIDSGILKIEN